MSIKNAITNTEETLVLNLSQDSGLFCSLYYSNYIWSPCRFLPKRYRHSLCEDKGSMKLTIHFHSMMRSRVHGSLPPLPIYTFMVVTAVVFSCKLHYSFQDQLQPFSYLAYTLGQSWTYLCLACQLCQPWVHSAFMLYVLWMSKFSYVHKE